MGVVCEDDVASQMRHYIARAIAATNDISTHLFETICIIYTWRCLYSSYTLCVKTA